MTSLEAFQKEEDLVNQLSAVVSSEWWAKVLAFAKAEMMAMEGVNIDRLQGVMQLENVLQRMSKVRSERLEPLTSGLIHEVMKEQENENPA